MAARSRRLSCLRTSLRPAGQTKLSRAASSVKAARSNSVPSPSLLTVCCPGTQVMMPSRSQALAWGPLSKPLSITRKGASRAT